MPLPAGPDRVRELAASIAHGENLVDDYGDMIDQLIELGTVAGERLAEIAGLDFDKEVSTSASYMLASLAELTLEGNGEAEELLLAAVPIAQRLVADPDLPEDRKLLLAPILISTGNASFDFMASTMQNLEGILTEHAQSAFDHVTDQPPELAALAHSLQLMGLPAGMIPMDLQASLDITLTAIDSNPGAAAAMVALIAAVADSAGEAHPAICDALGAVAETNCPQAAWWLRELAAVLAPGPDATLARALLTRMEANGIVPAYDLSLTFVEGSVSQVDPSGCRMIFLAHADEDGDQYVVGLLFADGIGIKDVQLLPPSDEESALPVIDEVATAPCTIEMAREFVADAFARHDTPPPAEFLLLRPYLGAAPIEPCPREPDLSAFPAPEPSVGSGHVEHSMELLDSPLFGDLLFVSDAAYEFLDSVEIWDDDGDDDEIINEAVYNQFVSEIAEPEKATLIAKMAANLDFAHLAGLDGDPLVQMAASVHHALQDGSAPFAEIPYVHGLCANSIMAIDENLCQGFTSQAEADAAMLEDLDDDSDGLGGDFPDLFSSDDPEP